MKKKIVLLGLFAVAILSGGLAEATLDRILPSSSHHQGFVWFNETVDHPNGGTVDLKGRIDFAVYNRDNLAGGEETDFVDNFVRLMGVADEDQFIYAYQIFNDYDNFSDGDIGYFEVLGLMPDGETTFSINPSLMNNTTGVDDGFSGAAPEPIPSVEAGIWEWLGDLVEFGTQSQFLLYSSVNNWKKGTYRVDIVQQSDDIVVPDDTIPEPATLTMLGIGGAMILRRRRKS
jgi:hypothetical protein